MMPAANRRQFGGSLPLNCLTGGAGAAQPGVRVTELRLVVDGQNRVAFGVRARATGYRSTGAPGESNYGSCL